LWHETRTSERDQLVPLGRATVSEHATTSLWP
jgi:hypothetical protein